MSESQKRAKKQAAAQLVLQRKMLFRSLALEDPNQTQLQILQRSKALLDFEVTTAATHEIEWELIEGPAVTALLNAYSRPKASAVIALFYTKATPSLEDVLALFDTKFLAGVNAVITLFNKIRHPPCDEVIAMFHQKPWPGVEDVQRERERVRGRSWPPAFKTNAEWEFHYDTIMMLYEDSQFKSAGKIQAHMSHYPFNFMPKERVYNDKIKYWKVKAGQFTGNAATPKGSFRAFQTNSASRRVSYDSGIDVRSLSSSGRESRQSTTTTISTSSDGSQFNGNTVNIGQEVPLSRHPIINPLETIAEDINVDIDDNDLAGHTIINGYNPRTGELYIAKNLVKYVSEEYIKLEEQDAKGNSLLHTAAINALPLVVLALIHQGANVNSVNHQGDRIWYSTALALENVEYELSQHWELHLDHKRGRIVDCLDLLEKAPGFSSPQFSSPPRPDSREKEKDAFRHFSSYHHSGHIHATATSFKKVLWPWW